MTGLLHRLAARANGSAWAVRSDARLPFAAEGLEAAPAPALAAHAPQAEPAPMLRPAAPAMEPPAQAQAESGNAPLHMSMAPSRLQQAPWQAPANAQAAAQQPLANLLHDSPQPQAHGTASPLRQAPTMHAPQEAAASPVHLLPQAARPGPAFTPQRDPAPLLPGHTAAAASAMPTGPAPHAHAATWARGAPAATREDTEVHIHIGRIDVTAVHETPKAKPRAREPAQPVSLQAYLATRKTP